ncbi:hypothetical protein ACOME3_003652 [Neoechinorhynchus agilis]
MMMDIEDIVPSDHSHRIPPIVFSNKLHSSSCSIEADDVQSLLIEENIKIYVRTWGCSHNSSDTEMMMGLLNQAGFRLTQSNPSDAKVWLLNSCTAKTPSEDQFRNLVNRGLRSNKIIIAAGCVPEADSQMDERVSVIGVEYLDKVVDVVRLALAGNRVMSSGLMMEKSSMKYAISLPKVRRNRFIEILPISQGCLNNCTYCKTKLARGHLRSYPLNALVQRCVQAFEDGVMEIWLTSEDLGAYGLDYGSNIVELVHSILQVTPSDVMIRLGMTNPPYILDKLNDIVEILKHPSVYSFLHIPVQSGSDAVLKSGELFVQNTTKTFS